MANKNNQIVKKNRWVANICCYFCNLINSAYNLMLNNKNKSVTLSSVIIAIVVCNTLYCSNIKL